MTIGTESLPAAFAALGDDTRWELLQRLGTAPASATTLAADRPISRQAVARHLEVLREAGLVETEIHGREVRYRAIGSRLSALARDLDLLAQGWERRLRTIKAAAEG
ncbi:ArsR/SmtB family transcription factor [Agromyces sp. NPDC056379]|uniref:ArsR/SmtB family transcription factor n=1 Tax=unclassified Agromyces TaxID=2639701 RepID=UPI0035DDB541